MKKNKNIGIWTAIFAISLILIIELRMTSIALIEMEKKADKYPCFNEYEHYNCQYTNKATIVQETDQYGKWFVCKNSTETIYRVRAC